MAARPLRLGIVPYLNARPLAAPVAGVRWSEAPPARLVERLARGKIDAGLLPVLAYARDPSLRLVRGPVIASRGPVGSVLLFCRTPLARARRIAAEPGSVTSVALLSILCRRRWGIDPGIVPWSRLPAARADAVLRIGDDALRRSPDGFAEAVDLGEAWTAWTGLPFVYAAWMAREGADPGLGRILRAAAARGRSRLGAIARTEGPARGIPAAAARRYLARRIRYRLGPAEARGLRRFLREAALCGLVPEAPPLRFLG